MTFINLNQIGLYIICIIASLLGISSMIFYNPKDKKQYQNTLNIIQLISISYLSFPIIIILSTLYNLSNQKLIVILGYTVFALSMILFGKLRNNNRQVLIAIFTFSMVSMYSPVSMINTKLDLQQGSFLSGSSLLAIIPFILLIITLSNIRKKKLSKDYNNIISVMLIGLLTTVILPNDYTGIVISALLLLPISFAMLLLKTASKAELYELNNKLELLEKEFNYELRKELNKRTFHLKEVQERMSEINKIDNLTKAYNKKAIFNVIEELTEDKKTSSFSIIMFDLDKFKTLNDTLGHVQGDMCLRTLSRIAFESVRDSDYFGRFGGDEFIIVLPDASLITASTIANRFKESVDKKTNPHFTVSVGLASYPQDGKTLKELLDIADKGLYLSKEKGRNSVSHHNSAIDKRF